MCYLVLISILNCCTTNKSYNLHENSYSFWYLVFIFCLACERYRYSERERESSGSWSLHAACVHSVADTRLCVMEFYCSCQARADPDTQYVWLLSPDLLLFDPFSAPAAGRNFDSGAVRAPNAQMIMHL